MESTDDSSTCSQHLNLPPGFRFHPTDEELVVHYLKKKATSTPLPVTIIADIDLYKFDPWELPSKAAFGEQEWYFFSPRDRKYPNGSRPNRAATSGYWKATGTDKPILSSNEAREKLGVKKALVFYRGKPPKGVKTNWIMHEYRLADNNISSSKPPSTNPANIKNSLRLDDWVLCRIYKKSNSTTSTMERGNDDYVVNMCANRLVENQEEYKYYENGRILMQSSPISQSSSMTSSSLGKRALSSSVHDQHWSLEDSPAGKRFRSNDHGNGMIMMDYGIDNDNSGGGGGGGGCGGSFLSLLNDQFTHQNDSTQLIQQNTVFLGSNNIGECSLHHQSYQFSWPNS